MGADLRTTAWSLALLLLHGLTSCGATPPAGGQLGGGSAPPTLAGCPVFPVDHVWNARVDALPVHPLSDAYVATIGPDSPVHPDFGSGLWEGAPIGIPFTTVGADQPLVGVSFYYEDESDPGPYPLPAEAPVEGAPPGGVAAGGDRHVLVVDEDDCVLYELFDAERQQDGTWLAGSGARFDLRGYELRPDSWTSADAAGLPILPGLVRYEEVASGEIAHALRFTAPRTAASHVWPARHHASNLAGEQYPPLGTRFRLRVDFDTTGMSPEARVVAEALKRYGMILADNGSAWFISGAPHDDWDNGALRDLRTITGADFEVVDSSLLMGDPNSGRVR